MLTSADTGPQWRISDLCDLIETYLDSQQVKEVYRAYLLGAEAHEGQVRRSGEPYIFHPVAVAYILGQMRLDAQAICAALLHDVIEDTPITKEHIAQEFGEIVAELVDGVSKLSSMQFETREQAQAANFQKMLLAMSRDLRVIIVKLADRLHNMRTLGSMRREAKQRIARETLEIYAPIANRLGMNTIRIELEELSFATLYPLRYKILLYRTHKVYSKRAEIFQQIHTQLEDQLKKYHLKAQVLRRERHYYGIYTKMREKKLPGSVEKRKTFSAVTDNCAFRIIVENVDTCYRALGIFHNLYKPICDRFRDYIAIPKANGYQSLHTVLFSPHGMLIEVQIRTAAMHEYSEIGIMAKGFLQRDDNTFPQQTTNKWLHDLLQLQESSFDSLDFFNHVKTELFPEEVYVFTPQGRIIQLPQGATALDFAYTIHSDVGNQCIAAKVDNLYVALSTPLSSGQTIEVITAVWARPNPSWLDFVVSARARSCIRHFLRNLEYEEAVLLGKRMLDKELALYKLSVDKLTTEETNHLVKTYKVHNLNTLLAEIGLGKRMAVLVARLFDHSTQAQSSSHIGLNGKTKPLTIRGTEGILVTLSHCCRPIPGDEIVGYLQKGRGIIIHTAECKNAEEYNRRGERWLSVEWEPGIEGEFLVDIQVEVQDQRGVLALVATAISKMDSNIESVSNQKREGLHSTIRFCISVRNRSHLAAIIRHLRRLEAVTRIQRLHT